MSLKKFIVKFSKEAPNLNELISAKTNKHFKPIPLYKDFYVVTPSEMMTKSEMRLLHSEFKENENIEFIAPYLENGDIVAAITNEFIVGLNKSSDIITLEDFCKTNDCKIEKRYEYDERVYIVSIKKHAKKNSIEIAFDASQSGLFRYAEPNF